MSNKLSLLLTLFPLLLFSDSFSKTAIITGITGQDGSYLAEFLLEKGYEVHGIIRRCSTNNTSKIKSLLNHIQNNNEKGTLKLHWGDLKDFSSIYKLIQEIQPDEIYNLAAQSDVRISFDIPEYTMEVNTLGVLNILEAIKNLGLTQKTKFYQASTSEMYGKVQEIPQTEKTPFYPRSPYGVAKTCAYWTTINYREAYKIFACNGILFNHESPRRGKNFVTRKITKAVAQIANGSDIVLKLGNLDAYRDWGYAKDYIEAMWLMLQQDCPDDFVISSGQTHSVREFLELAFQEVGIDIVWKGSGLEEKGINKKTGKVLVEIDPQFFRPSEVEYLMGDYTKAKKILGWEPKTSFEELVSIMVKSDCEKVKLRKGQ